MRGSAGSLYLTSLTLKFPNNREFTGKIRIFGAVITDSRS